MGKADLHMHSTYSDGYQTVGEILAHVARITDLDVIAITDHDCLDGSLLARDLVADERYHFQVIVGVEISTADGHLLALNIEQLIPPRLSMDETIQAVHQQGGLAVAAHPLSRWCPSASLHTLNNLQHLPDGLEVYNASLAGVGSNSKARTVNAAHFGWAELGGSDAHTLNAIGSSFTRFAGATAEEALAAIRACTTVAYGKRWPKGAFARCTYNKVRDRLPSPRAMTRRARARFSRIA